MMFVVQRACKARTQRFQGLDSGSVDQRFEYASIYFMRNGKNIL